MPADPGDRHALLRAAAAGLPGDTPRLDAELLLAHVLGEPRLTMLVGAAPVGAGEKAVFEALLARRRRHEPVAQIIGVREFWSLELRVTPDVLVPRPDSETLIAEALSGLAGRPPATVLDLGTGSGALLLAALFEWPRARGVGTDRSAAALRVAFHNARRLGLEGRAEFRLVDWGAEGWERGLTGFDLLLCNPPYVEDGAVLMPEVAAHEPAAALYAGADGLDAYRRLLPLVGELLRPGGLALFEFGQGQEGALLEMAAALGLDASLAADLSGRPRVLRLLGVGKAGGAV